VKFHSAEGQWLVLSLNYIANPLKDLHAHNQEKQQQGKELSSSTLPKAKKQQNNRNCSNKRAISYPNNARKKPAYKTRAIEKIFSISHTIQLQPRSMSLCAKCPSGSSHLNGVPHHGCSRARQQRLKSKYRRSDRRALAPWHVAKYRW